mgnify:FL=1
MLTLSLEMGMLSLIRWFAEYVEKATRPPSPPIDKTESVQFISNENLEQMILDAKIFYRMNPNDFNIAVVGAKSVGKSSLINGLLHFNDDDTSEIFLALGSQIISHIVFLVQENLVGLFISYIIISILFIIHKYLIAYHC